MLRLRKAVIPTTAMIMNSEELVNEISRPPICSSKMRRIRNCSRGLAPWDKGHSRASPVDLPARPEDVEHASAGTQKEEDDEEQGQGAEPTVQQPADPPADQQGRKHLDPDPKGEAGGGTRLQPPARRRRILFRRPLAQPAQTGIEIVQPCRGLPLAHRSPRPSGPMATRFQVPRGGGTLRAGPGPVKRGWLSHKLLKQRQDFNSLCNNQPRLTGPGP